MRGRVPAIVAVLLSGFVPFNSALTSAQRRPEAMVPHVLAAVTRGASRGAYRYEYRVVNAVRAEAPIMALQLPRSLSRVSGITTSRLWSSDSTASHNVYSAAHPDSVITAGRSAVVVAMEYVGLPGVVEADVFEMPAAWDAHPRRHRLHVIGPAIGSRNPNPRLAAIDILRQIGSNLVPELGPEGVDWTSWDSQIAGALRALERRETSQAYDIVGGLRNQPSPGPGLWLQQVHQSLQFGFQYVLELLARADLALTPAEATAVDYPADVHRWAAPDVPASPPRSLQTFFAAMDLALVGEFEQVAVALIDQETLDIRTKLVFRVREVVKGQGRSERVEVWTRGGLVTPGWGSGLAPAAAGRRFTQGKSYFVSARRFTKPGSAFDGQYVLTHPDAVTLLDGTAPVRSAWASEVVRQGQSLIGRGLIPAQPSDSDLFLATLKYSAIR